jgi:hypothetical protein
MCAMDIHDGRVGLWMKLYTKANVTMVRGYLVNWPQLVCAAQTQLCIMAVASFIIYGRVLCAFFAERGGESHVSF